MMRFYSLPPRAVEWPWLIVNPRTYKELYKRKFRHALLDPGVELFKHNPKRTDYPKAFLESWCHKAKQLCEIFKDRLWVTCPDYPDDYNPGQFGDNITKTLSNIDYCLQRWPQVNWLPVIQARYLDLLSFHESCQRLHAMIGNFPRVAIGTVCKTQKLSFIVDCVKAARQHFPESHIHAFGLTLTVLPCVSGTIQSWDSLACTMGGPRTKWRRVRELLDSFDSLAYTFPRKPGLPSSPSTRFRIQYFHDYVSRITELTGKDPRDE